MATRKTARKSKSKKTGGSSEADVVIPAVPPAEIIGEGGGVETTGRFIVVFKKEATISKAMIRSTLNQIAGLREVASSSDYEGGAIEAKDLAESEVVQFDNLGIVLISGEESVQALAASAADADSPILAIEPEYIAYPSSPLPGELPLEYLRGYKDAVNQLYDHLSSRTGAVAGEDAEISATLQDTSQFTWGLQATRVSTSQRNGQGIKVAVLDTGLDFQHPDFRGRAIVSKTFSGFPVQDIHGHSLLRQFRPRQAGGHRRAAFRQGYFGSHAAGGGRRRAAFKREAGIEAGANQTHSHRLGD